jgi:putative ABC transport system permease protein
MFLRLAGLFHRRRRTREFDDELESNLQMHIEDNLRSGMPPEEARYAALRKFGNVTRVKEDAWELWGFVWLEQLWQDIRYGLRMLAKNPGFTAVAVLTLALGIGANTAIFSVVHAVLIRPLPFKDPARLVMIWATWPKRGQYRINVSPADFADWKEQSKTIEHMSATWSAGSLISIYGEPSAIPAVRVTRDFFDLLGVKPARGRLFSPEEQAHGGFNVVVLSDSLWRKLGANHAVIGQTLQLNREPWRVIGVMPPGFNFPSGDEAWFPLPQDQVWQQHRGDGNLQVIGTLEPGVTLAQAQSEMNTITARLCLAYPQLNGEMNVGANVVSVQEQMVGEVRRALLVLMAAVGCLLLIACANAANLMLARAAGRQREFAVRRTLGASRWRVMRFLLVESILLAVAGGALGAAGAYWGVGAFVALDPIKLPRVEEIAVNSGMLLFTLVVALATGVCCGLAPAWRCSQPDVNETMKEGSERVGGARSHARTRGVLAVAQIALSLLLLTCAGLLLRSFVRRITVPLGFRPEGVLAVELPWNVNPRIEELLEHLRALPGVQSAGAATTFPHSLPASWGPLEIEGRSLPLERQVDAGVTAVTSDYFRAAGMTLLQGRFLADTDTAKGPLVGVVNDALAHRCFPGQDPLGKRIRRGDKTWVTIVGVVGNMKGFGVDGDPMPNIYFSRQQYDWNNDVCVLIRTAVPPSTLAGTVRKAIRAWNKNILIGKVKPMQDMLADSVTVPRFYMLLVSAFAVLALTLAAVGLYGLLNYVVTQRTHEFGVRMALGAEQTDVLAMVLRQGFALILTGLLVGLAGAWASSRVLESMLFQVRPRDAVSFVGACLALTAVGLIACYIPARRATKVDPMVALRHE